MGKLYEYIRGYYTVTASSSGAQEAIDLLVKNAVPFYGVKGAGEGLVRFRLDGAGLKKYLLLTEGHIIDGEQVERSGLFFDLSGYKLRIGFFLGALICAAIIAASSMFVWDIDVSGEVGISEDEILSVLSDYGFYIGAYIPNLDAETAELQLVIALDGLSYASINLRGTVAEVVVREEKENEVTDLSQPSNLIAAIDGQIESVEVLGGIPTVKKGQIVKAGALLVSGVIDSRAVGYRLVRARGNIYARVTVGFDAQIPLEYSQKTATGRETVRKTVGIFSKKINLFSNDEISYENYDTIESERRLCLFGAIELPIFIYATTYVEYELLPASRTETEAVLLASESLSKQSGAALSDAQILAVYTEVSVSDGVLSMHRDVECVLDIAREVFIETDRKN